MEEGVRLGFGRMKKMRWRKRREEEVVCPLGCGTLRLQSCGHDMGVGEGGHPDHRYETREGAPGELLYVQVALWQVVVVC